MYDTLKKSIPKEQSNIGEQGYFCKLNKQEFLCELVLNFIGSQFVRDKGVTQLLRTWPLNGNYERSFSSAFSSFPIGGNDFVKLNVFLVLTFEHFKKLPISPPDGKGI